MRLNTAYRALMQREHGERRARLKVEEKAWLKHHLSETRRLANDPQSGSGAFLVSQNYELDDIANRTLALEARVRFRAPWGKQLSIPAAASNGSLFKRRGCR